MPGQQRVIVCRAASRRRLREAAKSLAEHGVPSIVSSRRLASGAYSLRVPATKARQARRLLAVWMRKHLTPAEHAGQMVYDGWVSADFRKHRAAEAVLQAALADNPNDPILLTCLGAVLCDRCKFARAVPVLEKAIAQESTDRNAYMNLLIALMNSGDRGRIRALRLLAKVRSLKPSPKTWEAFYDPYGW